MARRKRLDCSREDAAIEEAKRQCGIDDVGFNGINLYCYNIMLPLEVGDEKAAEFANSVFHTIGVLNEDEMIDVGEGTDYCELVRDDEMDCYCVIFNHHSVVENDDLYEYSVAALREEDIEDEATDDYDEVLKGAIEATQVLAKEIKSGKIRSKTGEGYFVLAGEFYDAIAAGKKNVEYRDITPRNLAKSIGIKTVKFQRGYGHPGQPPAQMRFEVKSVALVDVDDCECDPYNVPPNFAAMTIAIHLGKRLG